MSALGHALGCPDAEPDECVWGLDPQITGGSLSDEVGPTTTWTTPELLANCSALSVVIDLQCPSGTGSGQLTQPSEATFVVECTEEQLADMAFIDGDDFQLSGGGCASPEHALVLLIPLWWGRRRQLS